MPTFGYRPDYAAIERTRTRITNELVQKGIMLGSNKFHEVLHRKMRKAGYK